MKRNWLLILFLFITIYQADASDQLFGPQKDTVLIPILSDVHIPAVNTYDVLNTEFNLSSFAGKTVIYHINLEAAYPAYASYFENIKVYFNDVEVLGWPGINNADPNNKCFPSGYKYKNEFKSYYHVPYDGKVKIRITFEKPNKCTQDGNSKIDNGFVLYKSSFINFYKY